MTIDETVQIEDMPLELLNTPLDWFFFEHLRHRQLCRLIDMVAASDTPDPKNAIRIVRFLRFERPLHILDEEEDLFPLVQQRSLPEDGLEHVLEVLLADHKAAAEQVRAVRAVLEGALADEVPVTALGGQARQILLGFASCERAHLALENAVVLPIARLRLTANDLSYLTQQLAARRGLTNEVQDLPSGGAVRSRGLRRPHGPAPRRRRNHPPLRLAGP
ncbi:hemerythrin domain-containing protein [Phenylobacterium koreense]|uniref:Hemerythrin-like domain-containing protein n=1 Tax=Phenylobacterium koreense TaxID=266125 RepID=A0ABV2ELN2_9CAUL